MIKNEIDRLFTSDGIIDVFYDMMMNTEDPEFTYNNSFGQKVNDCRSIMSDYLRIFILLAEDYRKLDPACAETLLRVIHESMFKLIHDFYTVMQELMDSYIDFNAFQNSHAFIESMKTKKSLEKRDVMFLNLLSDNNNLKIHSGIETRKYRVRIYTDDECSFDIEDDHMEPVQVTNLNILDDDGIISSKRFFFYQMLLMLLSAESFNRAFRNTGKDGSAASSAHADKIFFNKIDVIIQYAQEIKTMGFAGDN